MNRTRISPDSRITAASKFATASARLVSDAANPLLIPPLVTISAAFIFSLPSPVVGWISVISLLFYTVIPFIITLVLLQKGHITSFDVPDHKNRNKLFRYALLSSVPGSIMLAMLSYGTYTTIFYISIVFLINPGLGYLINQRFKISIHSAAVATSATIFVALYFLFPSANSYWAGILSLLFVMVLLPAMIWSRFRLGIHTASELISGVFAGIMLTVLQLSIMLIIW